jgi:Fe2+ transport system protein FeoA
LPSQNLVATPPRLPYFALNVKESGKPTIVREGHCAQPFVCPLSRVPAGTVVCIKRLTASEEIRSRLREMGLCEEQKIKLVSRQGHLICQVCNARLGISRELGNRILVETLPNCFQPA